MITLLATPAAANAAPDAATAAGRGAAPGGAAPGAASPPDAFGAILDAYAAAIGRLAGDTGAATPEAATDAGARARPHKAAPPADAPAADAANGAPAFAPITATLLAAQSADGAAGKPAGSATVVAAGTRHPAPVSASCTEPGVAAPHDARVPEPAGANGAAPATPTLAMRADPEPDAAALAARPEHAVPEALASVAQAAPAPHAALAAALPMAAPQAAPVALPVAAPVGTHAFAEEAATQVAIAVRGGVERASLTVSPPELGPVHVRIEVADGKAQVHFSADTPAARDALADALPRLRDALAGHGLSLTGGSVGADASRRDQGDAPRTPQGGSASPRDESPRRDAQDPQPRRIRMRAPGLVDDFA